MRSRLIALIVVVFLAGCYAEGGGSANVASRDFIYNCKGKVVWEKVGDTLTVQCIRNK